ncbi:hypothetical protein ANCDUO_07668 [Ancylostoma duodenale]|uniref:Uncharacterized protein n=1 Tax=Ancylostoma duodenale TaxID=51022 RepID=A0A0C2DHV3_9BILA|nr:hypothetical protein ANCDUO_07668 [Ancylostoma duodenale]
MNPARSFGPNLVASMFVKDLPAGFWSQHWIYYIGPAVGALVAVGLYRLRVNREFSKSTDEKQLKSYTNLRSRNE